MTWRAKRSTKMHRGPRHTSSPLACSRLAAVWKRESRPTAKHGLQNPARSRLGICGRRGDAGSRCPSGTESSPGRRANVQLRAAREDGFATRIKLLEKADRWEDAEAASIAVRSDDGDKAAHLYRIGLIRNNRANKTYTEGKHHEATSWYERALEAMPQDAVIWSNLAEALEADVSLDGRVDRLGRAAAALHRAVMLGGDSPNVKHVRRGCGSQGEARRGIAIWTARAGARDRRPALGIDVGADLLPLVIVPGTTQAFLSSDCLAAVERVRKRFERECGSRSRVCVFESSSPSTKREGMCQIEWPPGRRRERVTRPGADAWCRRSNKRPG